MTTNQVLFLLFIFSFTFANYQNPVLFANIPDPGVLFIPFENSTSGLYYSVSTSNYHNQKVFPIYTSRDMIHWSFLKHVFPNQPPSWTVNDFWAPEIHVIKNQQVHRVIIYYTARRKDNRRLSIGAAYIDIQRGEDIHRKIEASNFVDFGKPLYSEPNMGHIDAHLYQENNRLYFVWKNDGNDFRPQLPTHIYIQELDFSGLNLKDNTTRVILLTNDKTSWEMHVIEAPWIIKENGYYYLFYSGGPFYNEHYSLGVAVSQNLYGPYTRVSRDPVLKTSKNPNRKLLGPGHCSVVKCHNNKNFVVLYHAWFKKVDDPNPGRVLNIDRVILEGNNVKIHNGSPSEEVMKNPCEN